MKKHLLTLILIIVTTCAFCAAREATAPQKALQQKPASPPAQWLAVIGDYEGEGTTVIVREDHLRLQAICGDKPYAMEMRSEDTYELPAGNPTGETSMVFSRFREGKAGALRMGKKELRRMLYLAEAHYSGSMTELRDHALKAKPPVEKGDFLKPDLVNVKTLDPSIRLDIRYATSNNFMGVPLYSSAEAFLQRPVAEALVRVNKKLKSQGYGLIVFDAYRPWYVTKMFWDATPDSKKEFVGNPEKGSVHNRGAAVDLTLFEAGTGQTLDMGGEFDDFGLRSLPDYKGGTSLERWHRELLRSFMGEEGFTVYPYEWWHFNYKDSGRYPIMNVKLEDLK